MKCHVASNLIIIFIYFFFLIKEARNNFSSYNFVSYSLSPVYRCTSCGCPSGSWLHFGLAARRGRLEIDLRGAEQPAAHQHRLVSRGKGLIIYSLSLVHTTLKLISTFKIFQSKIKLLLLLFSGSFVCLFVWRNSFGIYMYTHT